MAFYIGAAFGFIIGTFTGIILTAILVTAREENRRIMVRPKTDKCKHETVISYHDNSVLCKDCNKVIWQGEHHAEPVPDALKEKMDGVRAK